MATDALDDMITTAILLSCGGCGEIGTVDWLRVAIIVSLVCVPGILWLLSSEYGSRWDVWLSSGLLAIGIGCVGAMAAYPRRSEDRKRWALVAIVLIGLAVIIKVPLLIV